MSATETANARLAQEAWDHLSSTGVKSVKDGSAKCIYSGSGCAFSRAIKDGFESHADTLLLASADNIIEHNSHLLNEWAVDCDPSFAKSVQACHDKTESGENFILLFSGRLLGTCDAYNVPIPTGLSEYLESQS